MALFNRRKINASEKSDDALREHEEKYRAFLDNARDAILIADTKGNILEANKKAEDLFGYTRKEILKSNISKIHPADKLDQIKKLFLKIKQGKSEKAPDVAVLKKDGTIVFVDIAASVIEYSGKKALQGIFRDITEHKIMEDNLRKSEEKYRTILASMQEGYFEVDLAGNLTFANKAMCKNLGFTEKELIGMNFTQYTSEETANELYKIYNKIFKTGEQIKTAVFEFIRKDKTKLSAETSASLISDEHGKPIGFRGVSRDVTERKQMEDALRLSEEKYRTILENMEEGYFELDLAGNATFFNDSTCRIFGYPREELQGLNYRQYTDEENSKKCFNIYNQIYKTGNPSKIQGYEIIRKDKTKRYLETAASLRKDSSGKIIGFRGVSRDVTERKKIEEELKQSEEKYRTILEEMQEGYFETDLKGNFTFVNDAECKNIGFSREELIGMNNRQYEDGATAKKIYMIFKEIYETGAPAKISDIEIITKGGIKKFNELFVSLMRDEKGRPIGFRGISRDITERKLAEEALRTAHEKLLKKNKEIEESRKNVQLTLEELEAAYKELKTSQAKILQQEKMASIGQLAAGVAHEINNPVAFISSNLGTLEKYMRRLTDFIGAQAQAIKQLKAQNVSNNLEEKRKELKIDHTIADAQKLLEESLDGTDRVQKIVKSLNRFSRVDDVDYRNTDINECIDQSINIVWNELKYKGTLHKDYGMLSPTKCYPQQLSQVFINILLNAAQAISEKGEIKIKTRENNKEIWISISDTGSGIPDDDKGKIFEPFFTTKEVGKGTGLGLSISYEIIQRHKGDISFESRQGQGTTFIVRLPVVL
jgi:two-component system NtrC family sensor kinase